MKVDTGIKEEGIIKLQWALAPDVDTYLIFSDNGSGTMNFITPIAAVPAPETSWQGIFNGNVQFVIQGIRNDGAKDTNTNIITGTSKLPGDFNQDGKIDIKDLALLSKAYGLSSASSDWNNVAKFNLTNTGNISKDDVGMFVEKFTRFMNLKKSLFSSYLK